MPASPICLETHQQDFTWPWKIDKLRKWQTFSKNLKNSNFINIAKIYNINVFRTFFIVFRNCLEKFKPRKIFTGP